MSIPELDNLVGRGLKAQPASRMEFAGLVDSAEKRLVDARKETLAAESRFDLAYNAAHGFALAALRHSGYRAENRYMVFQTLEHTLGLKPAVWRVLAKAHNERNRAEYEGRTEVDVQLLADLIACAGLVQAAVMKLAPPMV